MKIHLPLRMHNTVFSRFFLYFLLVVIITLAATSYFLYYYFSSMFKDEVLSLNQRILNQLSNFTDDFIMDNMNELALGVSLPGPYETYIPLFFSDSQDNYWETILRLRHRLDGLIFRNRDMVDSIYLYSKGKKLAISQKAYKFIDEREARSSVEFSWIDQAATSNNSVLWLKTRKTRVYGSSFTDQGDIITLVCTYPISSSFRDAKGYIAVNIKEETLSQYMVKFNSTDLGQLLIMDEAGAIISHSDKSRLYSDISGEHFVKKILLSDSPSSFRTVYNQSEYMVSFNRSKYNNWYYVSMVPTRLLYEKDYHIKRKIFVVSIVILFLVLILSNFFSYKIYRPLKRLVDRYIPAANASSRGSRANEYILLEKAFQDMSLRIYDLEGTLVQNMDKIIQNYLNDLLNKQASNNSDLEAAFGSLGISFPEKYFAVALFTVPKQTIEAYPQANIQLFRYRIIDYIKDIHSEEYRCFPVDSSTSVISAILNCREARIQGLKEFVEQVQKYTHDSFGFHLAVGVGGFGESLLSIRQSHMEARISILDKFIRPAQNEFYHHDISRKGRYCGDLPKDCRDKLDKALKLSNRDDVECILDGLSATLDSSGINYRDVRKVVTGLRTVFTGHLQDIHISPEEFLNDSELNRLLHPENLVEFFMALKHAAGKLFSYCTEKKLNRNAALIEAIESYIIRHIQGDLSLNRIAELFHISPQHLSKIFKEEKGLNYIDFVTRCKIEKAKSLLSTTNLNVDDITTRIGYSHGTYFSRKFKEFTGYTPSEYRLREVKQQVL